MAARLTKRVDTQTRQAIKQGMLIDRLTKHAQGKIEMSPSQVKAAEILLRKTLPDLSAIDQRITERRSTEADISDQELADIARGVSSDIAEETGKPH